MGKNILNNFKRFFLPCKENKYYPKFLSGKFLFYYVLVLLLLKLILIPFLLYLPNTIFFADLTKVSLIKFTNVARQDLGYAPLKENTVLNQAAYLKAKDMLEKGYFDHLSPEGVTPWHWFKISGYDYSAAGENLAIGFLESEEVHTAWMNSPTHQQNILNPNYKEIGIAVVKGNFQGGETSLVVQLFGNPKVKKEEVVPEKTAPEVLDNPEILETVEEAEDILLNEIEELEEIFLHEGEELERIFANEVAVRGEYDEVISLASKDSLKKTPLFILFQFVVYDYYYLIQGVVYVSLALIVLLSLVTIFYDIFVYHKFEIQYKEVIFKALALSALWSVLLFLDKTVMVGLINSQNLIIF